MKRNQRFAATVMQGLLIGGALVSGMEAHAKWFAPVERWINHAAHPELSLHQAMMQAAKGQVTAKQFTLEHARTLIDFAAYGADSTRGKLSRMLSTTESLPSLIKAVKIISGSTQVAQDSETAGRQYLVTGMRLGAQLARAKKPRGAIENALGGEIRLLQEQYLPAKPSTAGESEQ